MKYIIITFCILFAGTIFSQNSKIDSNKNGNGTLRIINPSEINVKGIYHFSSSDKWSQLLGSSSDSHLCSEIDPIKKSIKFKFEKDTQIYEAIIQPLQSDFFSVVFNGKVIFNGVFVIEPSESKIHVKFFKVTEEILPTGRYERKPTGVKLENSYFVKSMKTIEDCEMDHRIGGCTQDPIENREWPNCKPPGYNNLK